MKRLTQTDQGTNKIVNLVDPSNPQDAATKSYVDSRTPQITVGTSAPGSPSTGDLWVDTN